MKERKFFKVLKNNIECAFCKYKKDCPMQYYPEHKMRFGKRFHSCKKVLKKREEKALSRELP